MPILPTINVLFTLPQEFQSFKYMNFSSDMVVTSAEWHPTKRGQSWFYYLGFYGSVQQGCIGVSYARKITYDERVDESSKVHRSFVIIWAFSNALQPIVCHLLSCFRVLQINPTIIDDARGLG